MPDPWSLGNVVCGALLVASRWRMFHAIRVGMMIGATLLAAFWMVEIGLGAVDRPSQAADGSISASQCAQLKSSVA